MIIFRFPDSQVHGVDMGPIWGRQDPGGPHVGRMNLAVWVTMLTTVQDITPVKWKLFDNLYMSLSTELCKGNMQYTCILIKEAVKFLQL